MMHNCLLTKCLLANFAGGKCFLDLTLILAGSHLAMEWAHGKMAYHEK